MKINTEFIAYDGTHFYDYEACKEYEDYAFDMMYEVYDNCIFYDGNMKVIFSKTDFTENDIDFVLNHFANAFSNSTFMKMKRCLTDSCEVFIINYFGFNLPEKSGFYTYNDYDCWVSC